MLVPTEEFSSIVYAMSNTNQIKGSSSEFATFGAIHLNNTNLEKSALFWTDIVGMKLKKSSGKTAEFGTETQTLVVVHETAKTHFQKGYSGLYHFAIHAPNEPEFARMLNRLIVHNYTFFPTDHTASKSLYLDDPDGVNVEFTLETPERFKRVITEGGLKMEGTDGIIRSASERLDLNKIMKALKDKDVNNPISNDSYLGHLHLYVDNVKNSNVFYKQIGYIESNYLPQYMFADLGAGGNYTHRLAMNSWHGMNRPLAPIESAGMKHFQINYNSKEKLKQALHNVSVHEEDDGYWVKDPTGNTLILKLA